MATKTTPALTPRADAMAYIRRHIDPRLGVQWDSYRVLRAVANRDYAYARLQRLDDGSEHEVYVGPGRNSIGTVSAEVV